MKKTGSAKVVARAAQELRSLLEQISAIKVERIDTDLRGAGTVDLLARIDVLGHRRTLACAVKADQRPAQIRKMVEEMHVDTGHAAGAATPVLIAPKLSSSMQAVCKERKVGFLDFEGNARLVLDDVFIVKRSLPVRVAGERPVTDA